MGIVAGTVFWQQNGDPQSVMGILFQSMFFVSVGAMLKVPAQFEPRSIFYKQQDANFFPTWTFVAGRSLAGLPTSLIDGLLYGSIIYWFVGLSSSDGPAAYFIFVLLIICGSMTAGLVFSIFSATVKDKPTSQACMSVSIVLLVLFSGFTVQPDVIPGYVFMHHASCVPCCEGRSAFLPLSYIIFLQLLDLGLLDKHVCMGSSSPCCERIYNWEIWGGPAQRINTWRKHSHPFWVFQRKRQRVYI